MHKPQFFCLVLACSSVITAQTASHPAVVARIVVTNNCYYHDPPALTAEDVIVTHEYKPVPITALLPLRGERADLQLYVLVDSSSNWELGESLADLRQFVTAQPTDNFYRGRLHPRWTARGGTRTDLMTAQGRYRL